MSQTSEKLQELKDKSLNFVRERVNSAGFKGGEIPEETKATGFAGFGIPGQPEPDEDELSKNKALTDILARLYKTKPENFLKPVFDAEYEASRDILNEFFTYDFANWRKTKLQLNSESEETTPISLTKTSVKASFTDKTPEQAARQAMEMAYLAANNPVLMNSKKGVQLSYDAGDEQTAYFLYLAAEKMGFADKVLQAGYQPPQVSPEQQEQIQQIFDNAYNDMASAAANYAHPAAEPEQPAAEPESAQPETEQDTDEPEQSAEQPENAAPETEDTPEPDTEPQAEPTSKPDEPRIADQFNEIVNDPCYRMAVDYAAENGTISRSKLAKHVRDNGQTISSSTISEIFNVMEDQGLLSEATPTGRKYIGEAETAAAPRTAHEPKEPHTGSRNPAAAHSSCLGG